MMRIVEWFYDEVVVEDIFVADIKRILYLLFAAEYHSRGYLIFDGPIISDHMKEADLCFLNVSVAEQHNINTFAVYDFYRLFRTAGQIETAKVPFYQAYDSFKRTFVVCDQQYCESVLTAHGFLLRCCIRWRMRFFGDLCDPKNRYGSSSLNLRQQCVSILLLVGSTRFC